MQLHGEENQKADSLGLIKLRKRNPKTCCFLTEDTLRNHECRLYDRKAEKVASRDLHKIHFVIDSTFHLPDGILLNIKRMIKQKVKVSKILDDSLLKKIKLQDNFTLNHSFHLYCC